MVSFTLFRRIVIQKDLMKTKLLIVIGLVALCSAYVPSFGYTSGNTRVSPDTAITRTNVNTLKLKWSFQLDGPSLASAVTGVIGNRDIIFLPTFTGWLYAIVRTSGQLLWKKPLSTYTGKSFSIARSTCAVYGQVVVFGSQTGCELIAVNGTNGNKIWTKVLDTHPYCIITQSPTITNGGDILIGIASDEEYRAKTIPGYVCCSFMGAFLKVSLNGNILWKMRTVPNNGGVASGYSGAGIWGSAPAIDYARNRAYIATGNNYMVPESVKNCINAASPANKSQCIAANNYMDSLRSIDLNNCGIIWARRMFPADVWNGQCPGFCVGNGYSVDYDFMQGSMATTITVNNFKYDVLITVQKSGDVWATNRSPPGTILWKKKLNLNDFSFGSAVDAYNVYIAVKDGGKNLPMENGQACNTGHWVALNKNTGALVWAKCNPGTLNVGAPVTVTNSGVLFVSAWDGKMYALSTANGAVLWTSSYIGPDLKSNGPLISAGMAITAHGYRGTTGPIYLRAFGL